MKLHFIKSKEKKKIVSELEDEYGISEMNYLFLEAGKKKLRAFSGHLSKDELVNVASLLRVEIIGTYMISKKDDKPRLSFDVLALLKNQITKNIIEINNGQLQEWLHGQNLEIKNSILGLVVLKHGDDLVGVGKSNGEIIFNYVPKERKLRTQVRR